MEAGNCFAAISSRQPAGWQLVGLATEKLACGSRQKSRLLPVVKKLLWRKKRLGDFFPIHQPRP
jgi:hypothetical protein